ncbi:MAG: hypothetical protein FWG57_00585 [Endomicrobia bacterium]|nr:hypothetical protein [Endomicrobiia bacterium]
MIDTIKLLLAQGYKILNYELFKNYYSGYLKGFFEAPYTNYIGRKCLISWSLPIKDGKYRLRLIIIKNRYTGYPYLYIEFSIPKLLFGNNIQEVCEKDFEIIVDKLLAELKEMGVSTTKEVIEQAIVKKVHYSKNFVLPMPLSCEDVFGMVRESSFPRCKLLPSEKSYGNVIFNSKSLRVLFYNKFEEVKQFPNHLLRFGIGENRLLRVEIQYNKEYKIKSILQRFGYSKNDNTFKEMFDLAKFKKVFDYTLRTLHKNMPDMISKSNINEEVISLYKTDSQKAKVLAVLGFQQNKNPVEAKEEARKVFSENFLKTHNYILVEDENIQFALLKFLQEIENYVPLFRT